MCDALIRLCSVFTLLLCPVCCAMATDFHILCEFGSSSVTSGGWCGEGEIYLSFRRSNVLHVMCGDAAGMIFRFSQEVVWSASDTQTHLNFTLLQAQREANF